MLRSSRRRAGPESGPRRRSGSSARVERALVHRLEAALRNVSERDSALRTHVLDEVLLSDSGRGQREQHQASRHLGPARGSGSAHTVRDAGSNQQQERSRCRQDQQPEATETQIAVDLTAHAGDRCRCRKRAARRRVKSHSRRAAWPERLCRRKRAEDSERKAASAKPYDCEGAETENITARQANEV